MKKLIVRLIASISLLLISHTGLTQNNLIPEWLINSKGKGWSFISDFKLSNSGFLYVVGNYSDTLQLGDKSEYGKEDLYIAKYDGEGKLYWLECITSKSYCVVSNIVLDSDESLIVTGYFKDTISLFKNELISENHISAFIAYVNYAGQCKYIKTLTGGMNGRKFTICTLEGDKLMLGITFNEKVFYENRTFEAYGHGSDVLLLLLNNNGSLAWSKLIYGRGDDKIGDLNTNMNGEILCTLSFEENIYFDEYEYHSRGALDGLLLALNKDLEIKYSKQFGGFFNDYLMHMEVDTDDNTVLSGNFSGDINIDNDTAILNQGNLDVFVVKLDCNGNVLWFDGFGGLGNEYLSSMTLNENNSIYLTGTFRSEIIKGKIHAKTKGSSNDVFISKYSGSGFLKYIEAIGDTNVEYSKQIFIDSIGNILLSGNFTRSVKISELEIEPTNSEDFFLSKLYDCDKDLKIKLPEDTTLCSSTLLLTVDSGFVDYFWNNQEGDYSILIDSTGWYFIKAINQFGCISLDSIFVSINHPPNVYLGEDITVCKGEYVEVRNINYQKNDHYSYNWNNGFTDEILSVNTLDMDPGEYKYSLEVIDENGCSSKDDIQISVLPQISKLEECITIYPNPVKEHLYLRLEGLSENHLVIELISENGMMVFFDKIFIQDEAFEYDLNLKAYSINPGSYVMVVKLDGQKIQEKVIVL